MAASMRSVCRCRQTLFSAVSRYKCGILRFSRSILASSVSQSCSVRFSVNVAAREMRLLSAFRSKRSLRTAADARGKLSYLNCSSSGNTPAVTLCKKPRFGCITSPCRTICSSCVVFFPHKLRHSRREPLDDPDSAPSYRSHDGLQYPSLQESDADKTEGAEKKENIKTIPNLLTCLRMVSAPVLGYLVVCESFSWAFGIFVCAGISDLLDGFIARNFKNQTSALGSALDPLADKLLVSILTVSLTCVGLIPLPLTLLIVSRDFALIAGGFYIRYRSLPPPLTLSRYFDISHATAKLSPTFISKVNTGFQLTLVAGSLAAPVFGFVDHGLLQALWYTTGATTFASGVDYLVSWKKYVTLLEKDQKEL